MATKGMIEIKKFLSTCAVLATILAISIGCGGGAGGGGSEGNGGGEESATRTVEHAMGESEVPEEPERVVVLDTGELDSAVSLGVTPVGAVEAVPGEGFPSYLEGVEGVEIVGTIEEPNLETISTLEPDLILSSNLRHEGIYDQLSQIARPSSPRKRASRGARTSMSTPKLSAWRMRVKKWSRITRVAWRSSNPRSERIRRPSPSCGSSRATRAFTRKSLSSGRFSRTRGFRARSRRMWTTSRS